MPSTKKRDLPVTNKDMVRTTSCSTNHTPSSDASEWSRGVVVARQSQAGARVTLGGNGASGPVWHAVYGGCATWHLLPNWLPICGEHEALDPQKQTKTVNMMCI